MYFHEVAELKMGKLGHLSNIFVESLFKDTIKKRYINCSFDVDCHLVSLTPGVGPSCSWLCQWPWQPPWIPALQLPQGAAPHLLLPGGVCHWGHPPLQVWDEGELEGRGGRLVDYLLRKIMNSLPLWPAGASVKATCTMPWVSWGRWGNSSTTATSMWRCCLSRWSETTPMSPWGAHTHIHIYTHLQYIYIYIYWI